MSLDQALTKALDQIPAAGGTLDVPVPSGHAAASGGHAAASGGRLRAVLDAVDAIGCAFEELALETPALRGADTDRLAQTAQHLARRITYLLEPLRILEVDDRARIVQMRSVPPSTKGTARAYYEVLVREGGAVSVRRFEAHPGKPRRQVPAQVTREVFIRLAHDLVDSL